MSNDPHGLTGDGFLAAEADSDAARGGGTLGTEPERITV